MRYLSLHLFLLLFIYACHSNALTKIYGFIKGIKLIILMVVTEETVEGG